MRTFLTGIKRIAEDAVVNDRLNTTFSVVDGRAGVDDWEMAHYFAELADRYRPGDGSYSRASAARFAGRNEMEETYSLRAVNAGWRGADGLSIEIPTGDHRTGGKSPPRGVPTTPATSLLMGAKLIKPSLNVRLGDRSAIPTAHFPGS